MLQRGSMIEEINIFNFLRGIAAISVFLLHCLIIIGIDDNIPFILYTPAWSGVWIFFIISGYLIGKSYCDGRYLVENNKDFFKFYIVRAIRIFPVYFFIILIDIFFVNTNLYFENREMLRRVFTLTLRQPYITAMNGNLWFISTICQLYLITPFFVKFVLKPIKRARCSKLLYWMLFIVLFIYGLCFRSIMWQKGISWDYNVLPSIFGNIDLFFCGFTLNLLITSKNDNSLKKIGRVFAFIIFLLVFVVNCYFMKETLVINENSFIAKDLFASVMIVVISVMIWAFDRNKKVQVTKSIYNPIQWLEWLGIISFGFYLCHCQTIYNLTCVFAHCNKSMKYIGVVSFSFIFTLIWGYLIHVLLEKPLVNVKKSIIKNMDV